MMSLSQYIRNILMSYSYKIMNLEGSGNVIEAEKEIL